VGHGSERPLGPRVVRVRAPARVVFLMHEAREHVSTSPRRGRTSRPRATLASERCPPTAITGNFDGHTGLLLVPAVSCHAFRELKIFEINARLVLGTPDPALGNEPPLPTLNHASDSP
jgi:hypothetical protein